MWPKIRFRYNHEKEIWVVHCDGEKVAEDKNICKLCKKYRYCDFDGDRCGVLS